MLRTSSNKFFSLSFLHRPHFSSNIYNSIYSASIDPNHRETTQMNIHEHGIIGSSQLFARLIVPLQLQRFVVKT